MRIITEATACQKQNNFYVVKTNEVDIRLWFMTDDIIRIRAGFDGDFHECSYSLCMTAWDDGADELLKDYRSRVEVAPSELTDNDDSFVITGNKLVVRITKAPYQLEISDKEGHVLHRDCVDLALREDSNHRRMHTSEIEADDGFYGFGEKGGDFNKAQQYMALFPTDAMGYDAKRTDSLYKHIAFYIKLSHSTTRACGYFYHTTSECDFDMGRRKSNYWHRSSTFRTDNGDIDLFFIAGPKVCDVVQRFTSLTGRSAMLPKGALGYLGSSMFYSELEKDCDKSISRFIDNCGEEDLGIDGFQLSSGYCTADTKDGLKRCVFTWNKERFPDPSAFFKEMNDRGVLVSPNVKPGILKVHPKMQDMLEHEIFIKDEKEDKPATGTWWGGKGYFADFTNPKGREYWKQQLKDNLFAYGCRSVWNDNCEYDSLVNKDSRCCYEGYGARVGAIKAAQSNIFCHITVDALKEYFGNERPFIVCRSGHAGIQRYAQTWCGDNLTHWDTLRYNVGTLLGMSLSGVANQGADIGGFYGPAPEEELFVRWVQNGIFQPRFSIHSVNIDNSVTEPWMYSRTKDLIHDAIALRYALSPYFYSLMYRAHVTGLPYFNPMLYAFQQDPACYDEQDTFMLGDALLVANILYKGQTKREVYFPKDEVFYDMDGYERYEGGETYEFDVDLASIPMFLRAGEILVLSDTRLHNLQKEKVRALHVITSVDKDAQFTLFEDDGVTFNYEKGDYRTTSIELKTGSVCTLSFNGEGSYKSDLETMHVELINKSKCPFWVKVGDRTIVNLLHREKFENCAEACWRYSQTKKCVEIRIPKEDLFKTITVSFEPFDMIGM